MGRGSALEVLLIGGLGWPELLVILGIVILIFGGTKLAGLGKASGRAIREFKDEIKGDEDKAPTAPNPGVVYTETPAVPAPAPVAPAVPAPAVTPPAVPADQTPAAPAQTPPTPTQ